MVDDIHYHIYNKNNASKGYKRRLSKEKDYNVKRDLELLKQAVKDLFISLYESVKSLGKCLFLTFRILGKLFLRLKLKQRKGKIESKVLFGDKKKLDQLKW